MRGLREKRAATKVNTLEVDKLRALLNTLEGGNEEVSRTVHLGLISELRFKVEALERGFEVYDPASPVSKADFVIRKAHTALFWFRSRGRIVLVLGAGGSCAAQSTQARERFITGGGTLMSLLSTLMMASPIPLGSGQWEIFTEETVLPGTPAADSYTNQTLPTIYSV